MSKSKLQQVYHPVTAKSPGPVHARPTRRSATGVFLGVAILGILATTGASAAMETSQPIPVVVKQTADGFKLLRGGKPYQILGVGGRDRLEELARLGGNSIRTWHARGLGELLDEAHRLGLSVTVGLWLSHERHGFDYSDADAVARQHARTLEHVRRHKDHPAVLMWGIGNEMEGRGDDERVWAAVEHLAREIKAIDPHRPTMTVIAGARAEKIRNFMRHCPSIDVVGINAYGGLEDLAAGLERVGLDRPYVLTEFGPTGWWQVGKTSWGAELEPTSTAKAATYLGAWQSAVRDQPKKCFGSYAFLWGHKQEHTHTWFGMFLPTGERTAAVDVMSRAWTGKWPENRCPAISAFDVEVADSSDRVAGADDAEFIARPGAVLNARVAGDDPDGDPITARWELRAESTDKRSGGDPEEVPATYADAVVEQQGFSARIRLPEKPGPYRVFVYLLDGKGSAATANLPVMVRE
jgi:hypothetical protein